MTLSLQQMFSKASVLVLLGILTACGTTAAPSSDTPDVADAATAKDAAEDTPLDAGPSADIATASDTNPDATDS